MQPLYNCVSCGHLSTFLGKFVRINGKLFCPHCSPDTAVIIPVISKPQ